jgi:CP family cyanate transporter-like MFS transporter
VLVAATSIAIVIAAPKRVKLAAPARWWPDWRHGQVVRIGLVMGMASAAYFGTNAFIPDFLDQTRRHDLISPTLAVLNASQLLTSPAVALWPRFVTGRFGFVSSSVLMGLGQLGLVLTPGPGVLVWAFFTGFGSALGFIVALSLPPRLAPAGDVHRMSAAMFTIQYTVAFVVPLIAGALWDVSGLALVAFVPGVIGAGVMAWLALGLRIPAPEAPAERRPD